MDSPDRWSNKFDELRSKAEQILSQRKTDAGESAGVDLAGLIHELEVHQVELQLQNEELRSARGELEESRNRYAELYDKFGARGATESSHSPARPTWALMGFPRVVNVYE